MKWQNGMISRRLGSFLFPNGFFVCCWNLILCSSAGEGAREGEAIVPRE